MTGAPPVGEKRRDRHFPPADRRRSPPHPLAFAIPALAARAAPWLERHGRSLVLALASGWLLLFFLVPFLIVLKISFSEPVLSQPPYAPIVNLAEELGSSFLVIRLNLSNYLNLLADSLYVRAYLNSVALALISTAFALALGLPMATAMTRAPARWKPALLTLVILPFWTSFLIRVYAWIGILKPEGYLNALLLWLGLIDQPLAILNTNVAVCIGIVYSYLPFMILPIYASLDRMDPSLTEAAIDLGCRPGKTFWVITLPLAAPGIIAACLLVFIPAVGEFVIPDLLGGSETLMIGRVLWSEFFTNRDWPLASAVAVVLLAVLVIPIVWFQRAQSVRGGFAR
jgi:putrescine transport system permease protein